MPSLDHSKQEKENREPQKHPKVRFSLWSSTEQAPESPTKTPDSTSGSFTLPETTEPVTQQSGPASLPAPVEMVTYSRSLSEGGGAEPDMESG